MNSNASTGDNARMSERLQQYFDGTLSLEEARELADFWDRHPEFGEFAQKNLEIDQILRFFAVLEQQDVNPLMSNKEEIPEEMRLPLTGSPFPKAAEPAESFPDLDELVRLAASSPSQHANFPDVPVGESRFEPKPSFSNLRQSGLLRFRTALLRRRSVFALLGLSVLISVIFLFSNVFRRHATELSSRPEVLVLGHVAGAAYPVFSEGTTSYQPGRSLGAETVRLKSGMLELLLENGVRIVLRGPAELDIHSMTTAFCRRGRISIEVPSNASGFQVKTPFMNVRDIGTEFVVEVTPERNAVHVFRGLVQVDPLSGNWTDVPEGIGLYAYRGGMIEQTTADPELYVDRSTMNEAAERYTAMLRNSREERHQSLKEMPELRMLLDFSDPDWKYKGTVRRVFGTEMGRGRWASDKAVSFSRRNEVVMLSCPARHRSLTMLASVFLENNSQASNVLFSIGESGPGALHWLVTDRGELQLLLGDKNYPALTKYMAEKSSTVFHPGIWHVVGVTVDHEAGTITHYIDGLPIGTISWKANTSFDFTEAELGNWLHLDQSPTSRVFNGRIGEFILIGRVLTEEEIRFYSHSIP